MDTILIYAIIAGSLMLTLALIRLLKSLSQWRSPVQVFIVRHFIYPYVISRHTLVGPWSRAEIFTNLGYVTANLVLAFYKNSSFEEIGRRAGSLSLVNMIFPLAAGHLSYAADLLGISLPSYRKVHRASGWMTMALIVLHISAFDFDLKGGTTTDERHLSTIIVSGSSAIQCFFESNMIDRQLDAWER